MTAQTTHDAIKKHCNDNGKDWSVISKNPVLFNQEWRAMLGLPKDTTIPPVQFRRR